MKLELLKFLTGSFNWFVLEFGKITAFPILIYEAMERWFWFGCDCSISFNSTGTIYHLQCHCYLGDKVFRILHIITFPTRHYNLHCNFGIKMFPLTAQTEDTYQNIISLSCHEQVCPLKHTCSWHDKLIILWILNRQAKISLCTPIKAGPLWRRP